MCIAIYSTAVDFTEIQSYLCDFRLSHFDRTEKLIPALSDHSFTAAFVAMGNAAGMEAVIAIRRADYRLPVAWFSNDRDFAAQAYRLNIEYFTVIPLSARKIQEALKRCRIQEKAGGRSV